jgi:SAM-dependent methyltransferase
MSAPRPGRAVDAAAFQDEAVAAAYRQRPPYPEALIARLADAVVGQPRRVLDLGCGTGDISLPLAPYVDHIDAVDISKEMIAAGRARAGGDSPTIAWHVSPAEDFVLAPPYGSAIAAESLGWLDMATLLPRLAAALTPGATLAFVSREERAPWDEAFFKVIPEYSMSLSYAPRDLVAEIEAAGLGRARSRETIGPEPFTQSVDDYVELQHSRSAFALHRMAPERAAEFDTLVREIVGPYATEGQITYQFSAPVVFLELAGE